MMISIQAYLAPRVQENAVLFVRRQVTSGSGIAFRLLILSLLVAGSPRVSRAEEPVELAENLESSTEESPASLPVSLARAARDYRIEVYRAFRLDRKEFDRRQEIGRKAIEAWRTSLKTGSRLSDEELNKLTDWFVESTVRLRSGDVGSEPEPFALGDRSNKPIRQAPVGQTPTLDPAVVMAPRAAPEPANPQVLSTLSKLPPRTHSVVPPASGAVAPERVNRLTPELVSSAPKRDPRGRADFEAPTVQSTVENTALATQESPGSKTQGGPVRINLNELSARTRGWNLALKRIENRAMSETPLSTEEISELVDELQALLQRRRGVELYHLMLEPHQLEQVGQLDSLESVVESLQSQWNSSRLRQSSPAPRNGDDSANATGGESSLGKRLERLRSELE